MFGKNFVEYRAVKIMKNFMQAARMRIVGKQTLKRREIILWA